MRYKTVTNKASTAERYIVFFSMLYMTIFLASMTVGYKIVAFGSELYCASILIFPLLFPLSDALTELYGPSIAKKIIWYSIICEIIFVSFTNFAIQLPSPLNWHHQSEFNFVVGSYIHILLANVSALLVSFYLNVLVVNKWRTLLNGRYYFFRSLGATAIGEISYTIITNVIAYMGVLSGKDIFNIIISDYFLKMGYSFIIAYPAAIMVWYVKLKCGISNHYYVNFNPFKKKSENKIIDLSKYAKKNIMNPSFQSTDKSAN